MLRFLLNSISRSLEFSKAEAKGTLALIFVIIVAITTSRFYIFYLKKEQSDLNPTEKKELEEWATQVRASIRVKKTQEKSFETPKHAVLPFVPQPEKKRETKLKEAHENKKVTISPKIVIKDLNTTTLEALQEIRGVGPVLSERIVKYRDLLGGFSSTNQLSEVYGLPGETIDELVNHYAVRSAPTPLKINSDSAKVLARHPYISYDLAWVIINYRKQHGDIHSMDELKKIKSLDSDLLEKLRPYVE